MKRVVVYVSEEIARELKSALALRGESITSWFREKAKEELQKKEQ